MLTVNKVTSYTVQYPILRVAHSGSLYSLTHLSNMISASLEASNHGVINEQRLFVHPPLFVAKYSFVTTNEVEQWRIRHAALGSLVNV